MPLKTSITLLNDLKYAENVDEKRADEIFAGICPGLTIDRIKKLIPKPEHYGANQNPDFNYLYISILPERSFIEVSFLENQYEVSREKEDNKFTFSFFERGLAELESFYLYNNVERGEGFTKLLMQNFFSLCDEAEKTRVELLAGSEMGGYVWLRYGAKMAAAEWDDLLKLRLDLKLNHYSKEIISALGQEKGQEYIAACQKLIYSDNPESAWALAQLNLKVSAPPQEKTFIPTSYNKSTLIKDENGKIPLGLALFVGEKWRGIIITKPESPGRHIANAMTEGFALKFFPKDVLTKKEERVLWNR